MEFGERLKKARNNANLTQQELANELGVSKSTITSYETGAREPNLLTLTKICKILNVEAETLLGIEKTPESEATDSEAFGLADQLLLDLRQALISGGLIGPDDDIDPIKTDALIAVIRALFGN